MNCVPVCHSKAVMYRHVREIKETADIKEAAQLLADGPWVIISIAFGINGSSLFCLGKVIFD